MREFKSNNKYQCLIVNMGSPKSYKEEDVAQYLREFLMDKYVLQMPWLLRFFLVNFKIVPNRKKHSAELYRKIWNNGKSPLIENTELLVAKLQQKLYDKLCSVNVTYAMRYGENSIKSRLKELSEKGAEKMLVLFMYPQYEKSTYLTAYEQVDKYAKKYNIKPIYVPPFFDQADYISSLERSIREGLNNILVDQLVFSYHGVPLKYLPCGENRAKECVKEGGICVERTKFCGDCYRYQCYVITDKVCENIGAKEGDFRVVFQSKLGHSEWLTPTLRSSLCELPSEGLGKVAVIAPSFPADCLETLYEIDVEGRDLFFKNRGQEFYYINALNDLDLWAKKLSKWVIESKRLFGDAKVADKS